MNTYRLPLGRTIGYAHPHPERTASRSLNLFSDIEFKVWPARAALARTIRMQQQRESRPSDWRPLVPLTPGEGH